MEKTNSTQTSPGNPPGPANLPLLGSLLSLSGGDILQNYLNLWKKYGDIVYLRLGNINSYLLFNPEDVHHVLVRNQKNYLKGRGYDGFRLLVGNGLVTSEGDLWRQQRRLMQPYFTPTAVGRYAEMMVETTSHMLDRWEDAARSGEVLNMDREMTRLTMSIISRTMFSLDLGEEPTQAAAALQDAFAFIPEYSINPLIPISFPLPKHRRFRKNLEQIDEFVLQQIELGRESERDDLLSILLKAQDESSEEGMSDRQLRDEVVTLFFAGFETTARSLTWGWYLLLQNPEAMRELQAEADRLLRPGAEQQVLDELAYSRMVVDETLRLYPPTAVLARENIAEDQLGGYTIPAGSMVVLVPYAVHRYPDIWPEADRFMPERFAPDASQAWPRSAYIPFASGPRVCLGNNFALMEMVYAFSMAAARFNIERVGAEPIEPVFSGTTRPTYPLLVQVSKRGF